LIRILYIVFMFRYGGTKQRHIYHMCTCVVVCCRVCCRVRVRRCVGLHIQLFLNSAFCSNFYLRTPCAAHTHTHTQTHPRLKFALVLALSHTHTHKHTHTHENRNTPECTPIHENTDTPEFCSCSHFHWRAPLPHGSLLPQKPAACPSALLYTQRDT
jgi:hypothetical protein